MLRFGKDRRRRRRHLREAGMGSMRRYSALAVSAGATLLAQTPGADIHYVPTPDAVVHAMLDAAQVTSADVVYDSGSGDGRIVIEAARNTAPVPWASSLIPN